MQVAFILEHRFPGREAGYSVEMGPDGPYISRWDAAYMGRAQPTAAELASWELPAMKWAKRRELRHAHEGEYRRIFELDGSFMESERDRLARREAAATYANLASTEKARVDQRRALESRLTERIGRVNASATVAEVEAVAW